MTDRLIINASGEMSWSRRLLTWTSTTVLWGIWLYLWEPIGHKFKLAMQGHQPHFQPMMHVVSTLSPVSLTHALFALIGTTTTLLLWTFLPGKARTYHHGVEVLGDYARYFQLSESSIKAARESQICIVHHDDEGKITSIETRATGSMKAT